MQGKILAGRYRLVHQLGKGGMGAVWTAEHLTLRSAVAVKLLDSEIAKNPEAVERFQREAQAAATLRSAHVVQVLDFGVDGSTPYLVMELLQGEDLAARLCRVGRLPPDALVEIMDQVARAVGRAHEAGIVHRDLKPENIFLVNEGDHELVKVLDFGIAKSVAPGFVPSATRTGVTMGTPYYMSPEQAEGKRDVDYRTDLWALGVIASECLTGIRPFDGETFGELLLNICARPAPIPSTLAIVPRHFDAWFAKATHRAPGSRFASARELASTLATVAKGGAPSGMGAFPMSTAPMDGPPTMGGPANPPQGNHKKTTSAGTSAAVTSGSEDAPELLVSRRGSWLFASLLCLGLVGGAAWWSWARTTAREAVPAASAASDDGGFRDVALEQRTAANARSAIAGSAKAFQSAVASAPRSPPQAEPQAAPKAKKSSPVVAPSIDTRSPNEPVPAKTGLRCASDPFTGALRPASDNQEKTVACKQNPFSGQYQRL